MENQRKKISAQNLLGSEVYSKDGRALGVVKDIRIDPEQLSIESIILGDGLIHIGIEYVLDIHQSMIIVDISPLDNLIGKKVYDDHERFVGTVIGSKKNDDLNFNITIAGENAGHKVTFGISDIRGIGKNIYLNSESRTNVRLMNLL